MARTELGKKNKYIYILFSEDYTSHRDSYAKTTAPKEPKYSWLIKRGREGMAPAHRLPLLRFFIAQ